ncbi:MAG: TlyA family RNA methyltransferase [Clostridiales bacterium]|nr:TlyA family RNA methyltransferase [Clostridiales bacterium]
MKIRLDAFLVENGYFNSRTKAKQSIERGEVVLNSKTVDKCSLLIDDYVKHKVEIIRSEEYVSLGGYKLSKAIKDFKYNCSEMVAADIGASTGGFTDCFLKNGVKKVFAVDLNDDLLHKSLKEDSRVIRIIKNAKDLTNTHFSDKIDLLVADLSFISVTMLMPVFSHLVQSGKDMILLIKPQFETGFKTRFKNGIIRDEKLKLKACLDVYNSAIEYGFAPKKITFAPLFKEKNTEFLMLFKKDDKIELTVDELHNFFNIHKF